LERRSTVGVGGTLVAIWLIDIRDEQPWSVESPMIISIDARTDDANAVPGDQIPDLAVEAIRDIVAGKLPPGARALL
jgi:hypothetical protein